MRRSARRKLSWLTGKPIRQRPSSPRGPNGTEPERAAAEQVAPMEQGRDTFFHVGRRGKCYVNRDALCAPITIPPPGNYNFLRDRDAVIDEFLGCSNRLLYLALDILHVLAPGMSPREFAARGKLEDRVFSNCTGTESEWACYSLLTLGLSGWSKCLVSMWLLNIVS